MHAYPHIYISCASYACIALPFFDWPPCVVPNRDLHAYLWVQLIAIQIMLAFVQEVFPILNHPNFNPLRRLIILGLDK